MEKKLFTQYEIRQELANYAYAMFSGAQEIVIHYQKSGAFVYARFVDKVKEYAYVAYDTIRSMLEIGQHGRARLIMGINEDEMLADSINYLSY